MASPPQHVTTASSLPLESGDRLSRSEFEQRYRQMPTHIKAELVEGVVYMASPVRARSHGLPHALVMTWLGTYWATTPGVQLFDNATLRLDFDNELQPDALLRIDEACGGSSHVTDDDYIEGVPELIVEIAASSAAYDLHDKFHAYRRNGVKEYLVWTIHPGRITWFHLRDGMYEPLPVDSEGIIRSEVFPGLFLRVQALVTEDLMTVLATLRTGIESPEHQAFVEHLAGQASQFDGR